LHEKPSKEDLAANGFFHLQIPEYTQCAFCLAVIHLWNEIDVASFHEETNENCPFVKGDDVGNIPLKKCNSKERMQCVVCLERIRKGHRHPAKQY
ncbi:hypothetical protein B4U80_14502, partial [Leptotrombidium deliense]